ncbi:MAG: DNA polymerase III subunit gamma/tau [Saprospiraceae bacterium]
MSNFVVSARKYRPMRFDEVVGQEHVSQTLKNAFKNDHLAHAFLFCGPRGVGKTTSARILAKVLNCENVTEDFEPCNECHSCESFNGNASFNITELDAASNNSVEHIRALIEQVRFQPQQGKFKIYIIDEVHMLSQQAFNAFLKTLEEPPAYAKFILATTEKHKIIPTILSRCQIFDFNRIQIPAMVSHLQNICKEENITAEPDALHIIAQKADGALRDSLSIFDRIVSFSNDSITYEDVITNLNVLDYDYFFRLLDAMFGEDVGTVLMIFDDILRKGFDPSLFVNSFAEHIRNILVSKDKKTVSLLEIGEALKARYLQQAQIAPLSFLLAALNIANECDVNYKMARNKRLHVEMSLIKMTYLNRAVQAAKQGVVAAPAIIEKKNEPHNTVTQSAVTQETPPKYQVNTPAISNTPSAVTPTVPKIKPQLSNSDTISLGSLKDIEAAVKQAEKEEEAIEAPPLTLENIETYWKEYLQTIESSSTQVAFKGVTFGVKDPDIIVTTTSNFMKSTIQEEREVLTFLKKKFYRKDLNLSIEVSKAAQKAMEKKTVVKRALTPKEKFLQMRAANPAVDDLRKRFQLFPDE